jgi:hypothetical protein
MKKLLSVIILVAFISLLIGMSSGGFVDEPTEWNNPDFKGYSDTYICPFCNTTPINFTDFLIPQKPVVTPTIEPEKTVPIVMPTPLPYTRTDIANLIGSFSKPKQTTLFPSKLATIFF